MVKGRIARRSRHVAKPMLGHASKLLWREALDRPSTIELLEDRTLDVNQDRDVALPVLDPVSGVRPKAFDRNHYSFDPEYVWRITTDGTVRSIRITPSGTVLLNNKQLLDVDFGSWPGLLDLHGRRRMDDVSVAIAPWSHPWAAYYDFLMFVVSKLCRIKDVLGQESWADPTICYPWRGRSFEREFLEMLDLDPEAVVDTGASVGLRADEVIALEHAAPMGPESFGHRRASSALARATAPIDREAAHLPAASQDTQGEERGRGPQAPCSPRVRNDRRSTT